MLRSPYRLRHRKAFDLIYKRGRRRSGALVTVGWVDYRPYLGVDADAVDGQPPLKSQVMLTRASSTRKGSDWPKDAPQSGIPTQSTVPQIAVVVSRKVSRKAVERNRIKRRIRAALAILLPRIRRHHWIAIYARSGALGCGWDQLVNELSALLGKAGLLDPVDQA